MTRQNSIFPQGSSRTVGSYELGPKIGRGGMANIYVAKDLRESSENPVVALKVIREELATQDPYYLDLFADEARTLERLKHDNLIRVFEIGASAMPRQQASSPDAHRYIAMELLLGRSLADVFDLLAAKGERFPTYLSLLICAKVAAGLHHAHELLDESGTSLELVHRDVNPSNIFLTFDGRVKLIDFGLARSRGAQAKTLTGVANGKVTYLAPEQIGGKTADRRIDIYQLGITLWELLTGDRLFKRATPAESLLAIQSGEIADVGTRNPEVTPKIRAIVQRSLRADPNGRYTTTQAMERAIDDALAELPKQSLQDYLETLFPGQREELGRWFAEVTEKKPRADSTNFPPAPVPSSDVIDAAIAKSNSVVITHAKKLAPIIATSAPTKAAEFSPKFLLLGLAGLLVGIAIGWAFFRH
jgi:eukaryotic-like serine/threonine-protein kinase